MRYFLKFVSLLLVCCLSISVQAERYWQDYNNQGLGSKSELKGSNQFLMVKTSEARYLQAGIDSLRELLLTAENTDVEIPLPNGDMAVYHFEYAPVAEQGLLEQYPEIRTFRGVDVTNPANKGRFSISPSGFKGMFRHNGETIFIDPQFRGDDETTLSYQAKHAQQISPRPADILIEQSLASRLPKPVRLTAAKGSSDGVMRSYRIAVAATGEYTEFSGGVDQAMAAIMEAINRVNEVFENDLGITLLLVGNNRNIVFSDPATDEYLNDSGANTNSNGEDDLDVNQRVIDSVIGSSAYDLGHLFSTGAGGAAILGNACNDLFKAIAVTGLPNPTGDAFHINFVAHELGHQFGANHTFNGTALNCGGGTRNQSTAFEPGSGSTIMAYAGICSPENLQFDSDPYFHSGSIEEITDFIENGAGGSCSVETTPANSVPNASAGPDVVIPANTPFVLEGSATDLDDPNGDNLTYVWEQMDTGTASSSRAEWVDDGSRAFIRSVLPSANPQRFIPNLPDVLDGTITTGGESLPLFTRDLNFRLTVRDGDGQTAFENKVVNVTEDAGPFELVSPSTGDTWSQATETVTWDVAATDQSPVSCANVDILFSANGGNSFDTVLIRGTANDGSQSVTSPSGVTSNARVMVRCSDNIFYAVGDASFELNVAGTPEVAAVADANVEEGQPLVLAVTLSAQSLLAFDVSYALTNGTTNNDDYGAEIFSEGVTLNSNSTLSIPAGIDSFTITVPTVQDLDVEEDETFTVIVGGESATGTISDDDSTGGVVNPPSNGSGGSSGGSSGLFMLALLTLLSVFVRRIPA